MSASVFDLKTVEPTEKMLAIELGRSVDFLHEIVSFIAKASDVVTKEWKYYGVKSGWVMKVLTKKKNVLFVIPSTGYFRISMTFGDKAIYKLMEYELPGFNKQELLNATRYAEGRSVQFDVKTPRDLRNALTLVTIKLST